MNIQQITVRELYEAMSTIEPACAAAAAKRAQPHHLAAMEDNLTRARQAIDLGHSLANIDMKTRVAD